MKPRMTSLPECRSGSPSPYLGQRSQQHGRRLGDTLRAVNGSSLRDFGTDSHQYYSYASSATTIDVSMTLSEVQ